MKGHEGGGTSYECESAKRERNRSHRELKALVAAIQIDNLIAKRQTMFYQMCLLLPKMNCSQDRRILESFLGV